MWVQGTLRAFPGGSEGKETACSAGHLGLIPGLKRFPGEGNGSPLQYSCLENPMETPPGKLNSKLKTQHKKKIHGDAIHPEYHQVIRVRICLLLDKGVLKRSCSSEPQV